jgi:two-component system, chemotaxis family, protein-glutamate methylesterase/glutaminase
VGLQCGGKTVAAAKRNIIVIGTSAGGLEALDELLGQLPTDLPASIFVVQHLAPEATGHALLARLDRHRAFHCALAIHDEKFQPGRVYICPPDQHLLIKKTHLLVSKGARENRYRPAIDPLFRSAAAIHGSRVIAVLLTGMLDDGSAGLLAVQRCGGVTVVQDPADAAYPDMPQNALNNLRVDHCVPIGAMGALIEKLANERPAKRKATPHDIRTEARIAERVLSDVQQVGGLGAQVPYNCPNCGGVLWQMDVPEALRYRCHTGHSFTSASLLASQNEKIEETLWVALRMFEERKNLIRTMAQSETSSSRKRSYSERQSESEVHIERIRAMLLSPQSTNTDG